MPFTNEASEHGQTQELSGYLVEMGRDTFENWQSNFCSLSGKSWASLISL